jgi:hypothetical protein
MPSCPQSLLDIASNKHNPYLLTALQNESPSSSHKVRIVLPESFAAR